MRIIDVAYYQVLGNFRNKKEIIVQIISPIILILIIGTALSGSFDEINIETYIGYVNEETNDLSVDVENYLQEINDDENIKMIKINNDEIDFKITTGEIEVVITTKNGALKVIKNPNAPIASNVAGLVVDKYNIQTIIKRYKPTSDGYTFNKVADEHFVEKVSLTSIDYYAVTMLAMYMMFGSGYGAYAMGKDYFDDRGERLKCTTLNVTELFCGLAIGTSVTSMLQGSIVVIFTKYVYGVNWGDDILLILFTLFTFSILATGLGMFFCVIFSEKYKGNQVLNILVPVLTLFSGGFMEMSVTNSFMEQMKGLIPNTRFHNVLFNIMSNESKRWIVDDFIIMWGMILFFYVGTIFLKRRKIQ